MTISKSITSLFILLLVAVALSPLPNDAFASPSAVATVAPTQTAKPGDCARWLLKAVSGINVRADPFITIPPALSNIISSMKAGETVEADEFWPIGSVWGNSAQVRKTTVEFFHTIRDDYVSKSVVTFVCLPPLTATPTPTRIGEAQTNIAKGTQTAQASITKTPTPPVTASPLPPINAVIMGTTISCTNPCDIFLYQGDIPPTPIKVQVP